LPLPSI